MANAIFIAVICSILFVLWLLLNVPLDMPPKEVMDVVSFSTTQIMNMHNSGSSSSSSSSSSSGIYQEK